MKGVRKAAGHKRSDENLNENDAMNSMKLKMVNDQIKKLNEM